GQFLFGANHCAPDFAPRLAQPTLELLRDRPTSRFHVSSFARSDARRRPRLEALEEIDPSRPFARLGEWVIGAETHPVLAPRPLRGTSMSPSVYPSCSMHRRYESQSIRIGPPGSWLMR